MAALNHSTIIKGFEKLVEEKDSEQFFFDFLKTLKFPAATIKRLREPNGSRNVASVSGDYGLAKQIYFHPAQEGEDLRNTVASLVCSQELQKHQIRFFLTTNFVDVVAYDKRVDDWTSFAFEDLRENYEFFLPLTGLYEKTLAYTSHPADVKACEKMGRLYDIIRTLNHYDASNIHELNVFLTRLLFCFFAEDTGIFPKPCQMTAAIESLTQADGSDLSNFFSRLFVILDAKPESPVRQSETATLAAFPYVNGGLFRESCRVPTLNAKARTLLLECGKLEWNQISPVIFGSMFQSVMDPEARHERGAHYTSEKNIFKVIGPLFLDALEEELRQILELKDRYEKRKRLDAYRNKLATLRFLDPACGSGNFLIIAYREIKSLELRALSADLELSSDKNRSFFVDWEKFSKVSIDQFYGIEIEEFPVEIARVSMWLMEHVMNLKFGEKLGLVFPSIPLKTSANFYCGNALTTGWSRIIDPAKLSYIFGNPPFGGGKKLTEQQRKEQVNACESCGLKSAGKLDYVSAWYVLAEKYLSRNPVISAAFVSTNSICQGEQVGILWNHLFSRGISINFAHQSFKWKNEAKDNAGVHCIIVGFSKVRATKKILFQYESPVSEPTKHYVNNINAYLLDMREDLLVQKQKKSLCNALPMFRGNQPTDDENLILSLEEKEELIRKDPGAEKFIRPFLMGKDYLKGTPRYCIWLVGVNKEDYLRCPEIAYRLQKLREFRLNSTKEATRKKAFSPLFDEVKTKDVNYLGIPIVTSENRNYIPIGFISGNVIPGNKIFVIEHAGLWEFAILTSAMHMVWMRTTCGRLESRYSYSNTVVYNTFPWPQVSPAQRQTIENLASNILMTREFYPDMTLADLYDPDTMPEDLRKAHAELDLAVDKLYRSAPFENDEARLRHLFTRYEKLIEAEANAKPSEE